MLGGRLVVAQHRPLKTVFQFLAVMCVLVSSVYLAHSYGRTTLLIEYSATKTERDQYAQLNSRLSDENTDLRERLAILERAAQVNDKAYQEVGDHLSNLQSEVFGLKEEVAFYRGIISSTGGRGLHIQSFHVQPRGNNLEYRYQLVLTQDMKSDKVTSGVVQVTINGEQSGESEQLTSHQLLAVGAQLIEFQFRHFQRIEGIITLPDGFQPHSVFIEVTAAGNSQANTEKTFDWPLPVS